MPVGTAWDAANRQCVVAGVQRERRATSSDPKVLAKNGDLIFAVENGTTVRDADGKGFMLSLQAFM